MQGSRKKRLLNQIIELGENVLQYEESIQYLRQNKPEFQDIKVHEELVKELEAKPISWLSKVQNSNNQPKIESLGKEEVKAQEISKISQKDSKPNVSN